MPEDAQTCFVISPIGEPGSSTRRRANGVLEQIIRPALEGFRIERADHDKTPGIVTESIIEKTIDSDLVVADLTKTNPNVMYELAVRHAVGGPFVQMMEEGGQLPFDIEAVNTVFFQADLIGRTRAIEELQVAASAALEAERLGNPIRRAIQFLKLTESEGSDSEILLEAIRDLGSQVSGIRRQISHTALLPEDWAEEHQALMDLEKDTSIVLDHEDLDSDESFRCGLCSRAGSGGIMHSITERSPSGQGSTNYLCEDCYPFAETSPKRAWIRIQENLYPGRG